MRCARLKGLAILHHSFDLFMESRADELVNIFQPDEQTERQKAFDLLVSIDAANVNTYKKILGNNAR